MGIGIRDTGPYFVPVGFTGQFIGCLRKGITVCRQVPDKGLRIAALLKAAGLAASKGEASRKLAERAVRIDGEVFEDAQRVFSAGFEGVLQIGKRNFQRVRLTGS